MKLNRKRLCRQFHQAEEGGVISAKDVNPYLLEKVLRPTLEGKAPRLDAIDYDQFEEEDIGKLSEYYERLGQVAVRLTQFVGAVAAIEPVSCKTRQFC